MVTLWIRVALALLGAVLVHSVAFLAGMGEPLAIVVGLVAGPLIARAILAWAPLGTSAPGPGDADDDPSLGAAPLVAPDAAA